MTKAAVLRAGWWRVVVRGLLLLTTVAAAWCLIGFLLALDSLWWWLLGLVLSSFLAVGPAMALKRISEGVPWAIWVAVPLLAVLASTCPYLPGDHYLRAYGEPVTTIVAERTWIDLRKGADHYEYVLRLPDGRPLEKRIETFRYDDPLEVGAPVEMLVDPDGVFEAREVEDRGFVGTLTSVTGGAIVLLAVLLSVLGELRRRSMPSGGVTAAPKAGIPARTSPRLVEFTEVTRPRRRSHGSGRSRGRRR